MSDADYDDGDDEVAGAALWLRQAFEKPPLSNSAEEGEGEENPSASFAIDPRALDAIAKIIRALGEENLEENLFLHVLDDRVRVTTRHRRTIFTAEARLLKPVRAAAGARFGLRATHLLGLAKHFCHNLACDLSADSSYLFVRSGKTKLSLPTVSVPTNLEIVPMSSESPEPGSRHVDTHLLRRGLAYVRRASRTDKNRPEMSTVEIENGVGRGGTMNALAVFEAVGLAGLDLKLMAADLPGTCALLNCFQHAHFSETADNYVFKDTHFAMAIQKAAMTFPSVKKLLEAAPGERLSVRAAQFTDALYCFAPLTAGRKTEVTLELARDANQLDLKVIIPSRPKNKGNSSIAVDVVETQSKEVSVGTKSKVDFRALMKLMTLNGDPDRLLQIAMFPRQLIVADEVDGLRTRAILARLI